MLFMLNTILQRFLFSTGLFFITVLSYGQLTINLTSVPASTPPGDDIYIAGNFNNWNPGLASYTLTSGGNGMYSITFTPVAGTLEFKFTRGSWSTVEGNASGNVIPNRSLVYNGGVQTVNLAIAGWEDGGPGHTAEDNVTILDENFFIPQLNRNRRIWIYLPPDYDTASKHYPVIYMHDGQNLFDAYTSFAGEWKIDESLNFLFANGDYGAIVVGIDNGGANRNNEYSNWKNASYGGGQGELYADFLVTTLKPYIDSHFRTLPGREYTGIAGSSLGGFISLSTAIDHQDVFSKVGLFSPAFWFSDSTFLQVLDEGIDEDMRIFFIAGDNESQTMIPLMIAMRDTLLSLGMDPEDLQLVHDADGAHSEWYWAREFPMVYEWLFDDLLLDTKDPDISVSFTYPNPADQYLKVQNEFKEFDFSIYTADGMMIRTGHATNDTIDVSRLHPGLYFLLMQGDGGQKQLLSRFFKQ